MYPMVSLDACSVYSAIIIDGQSAVVNDDGTIQAASVKTYHWIHKPSLYQLYDTYAKVLRVNEDRYGQQFWR